MRRRGRIWAQAPEDRFCQSIEADQVNPAVAGDGL